ncbi:MAG: site-specific integrase [Candidatus Kryptoniota bacterium]
MFLSKHKNGFYYVYYDDIDGKRKKITTKSKLKSGALDYLSKFNEELQIRAEKKLYSITLEEFKKEILIHSESMHSPKTTADYRTTFNSVISHFGNIQLGSMTNADIERYIEMRVRKTSIYAARKDIAYLSSAFNFAITRKYINSNPCHGISKPKIPEKMPLFLSRDEFQILHSVIDNSDLSDMVTFAVNTGCRQGEITSLTWNQVNLEKKNLLLDNRGHLTKSRKVRSLPLNKAAVEVLKRRKEKTKGELVFMIDGRQIKPYNLSKLFKKYVKRAKLNGDLHFHSLRHTFASWLVMQGVSLYQAQKLLGHSSPNVTAIYGHLTNDNLAIIVEKLSESTH